MDSVNAYVGGIEQQTIDLDQVRGFSEYKAKTHRRINGMSDEAYAIACDYTDDCVHELSWEILLLRRQVDRANKLLWNLSGVTGVLVFVVAYLLF